MNYRRARVGGDTYFFTVSLAQREGRLLVDHIDILRNAVRYVKTRHPWEHLIRDDTDFARHVDYIPYNPVKHGYADAAAHWPYSSIHRYVARGIIPLDWGGPFDDQGDFGER